MKEQMFEVTTLGQPLEVIKTQMASQRGDTMLVALRKVWNRGGVLGCTFSLVLFVSCTRRFGATNERVWAVLTRSVHTVYQGLIPWAWIEASTKGAVLLFAAAEIEDATIGMGVNPSLAGLLGGAGGGIAQACTWSSSRMGVKVNADDVWRGQTRPWASARP